MSEFCGIALWAGADHEQDSVAATLAQLGGANSAGAFDTLTPHPDVAFYSYATDGESLQRPATLRRLSDGSSLVCIARIDNRSQLSQRLGVEPTAAHCDADLVAQAYLRWSHHCVEHLIGDWCFAVWQPATQSILLARDHLGLASLYYAISKHRFVFATQRKVLLALDPALASVNEIYLAQLLLSWKLYQGDATPHQTIQRLRPAHTLTAAADGATATCCYWKPEDSIAAQSVHTIAAAAEGAEFHFTEAVRSRLRPDDALAASLSGGLDSSAVALTAARLLAGERRPLHAYTAAPLTSQETTGRNWFGNEWRLAALAAQQAPQMPHRPVRSTATTPLDGVREALWIHDGPVHAAGNAYWMHDLLRMARTDGASVLLTGQMGNLGISWPGEQKRRGLAHLSGILRDMLPRRWQRVLQRRRLARDVYGGFDSAIHADLAQRTNVLDAMQDDPYHPLSFPRETEQQRRVRMLGAGRTIVGALLAEEGRALGLEIRDPTADIRLLTYCLGVPAHLFVDPQTGMDRMLMRTAMIGVLPDAVRLNRRRGLQAADIIPRLRRDRDAMEACLDELERGNAIHYINLPRLRQVWEQVLTRDDWETHTAAKAVLLRGIMVGLFVQNPAGGPRPNLERPLPPADWELP